MPKKKRPKVNLAQPVRPKSGDLAQLFSSADDIEQSSGLQLLALRIDAIQPDRLQPRQTFVDDSLKDLSDSIWQDGVIQPIEVTEVSPGQYVIVHGERRWRAAKLAGLDTIPAIVRRRNYDEVTRFVRQLVENMQREDLNDVDRAIGLTRLKKLMEEELATAKAENIQSKEPWGKTITWAKVGDRLGMSRQRVSQLVGVLKLDEALQENIRSGTMSERESRVYQGLSTAHQRALVREREAGTISDAEGTQIARYLKDSPTSTVAQVIRLLRQPPPPQEEEPAVGGLAEEEIEEIRPLPSVGQGDSEAQSSSSNKQRDNLDYLRFIRTHLAKFDSKGHSAVEKAEYIRLLELIKGDVDSLIQALKSE
ncbi:MAG: ParB/RepB/Spo0J family partition protein [Chloroflexota bacterium]